MIRNGNLGNEINLAWHREIEGLFHGRIGGKMKPVWKIYDSYNRKVLGGSYNTESNAERAMNNAIIAWKARKEPCDLKVVDAEYIVNHDDILNLQ